MWFGVQNCQPAGVPFRAEHPDGTVTGRTSTSHDDTRTGLDHTLILALRFHGWMPPGGRVEVRSMADVIRLPATCLNQIDREATHHHVRGPGTGPRPRPRHDPRGVRCGPVQ